MMNGQSGPPASTASTTTVQHKKHQNRSHSEGVSYGSHSSFDLVSRFADDNGAAKNWYQSLSSWNRRSIDDGMKAIIRAALIKASSRQKSRLRRQQQQQHERAQGGWGSGSQKQPGSWGAGGQGTLLAPQSNFKFTPPGLVSGDHNHNHVWKNQGSLEDGQMQQHHRSTGSASAGFDVSNPAGRNDIFGRDAGTHSYSDMPPSAYDRGRDPYQHYHAHSDSEHRRRRRASSRSRSHSRSRSGRRGGSSKQRSRDAHTPSASRRSISSDWGHRRRDDDRRHRTASPGNIRDEIERERGGNAARSRQRGSRSRSNSKSSGRRRHEEYHSRRRRSRSRDRRSRSSSRSRYRRSRGRGEDRGDGPEASGSSRRNRDRSASSSGSMGVDRRGRTSSGRRRHDPRDRGRDRSRDRDRYRRKKDRSRSSSRSRSGRRHSTRNRGDSPKDRGRRKDESSFDGNRRRESRDITEPEIKCSINPNELERGEGTAVQLDGSADGKSDKKKHGTDSSDFRIGPKVNSLPHHRSNDAADQSRGRDVNDRSCSSAENRDSRDEGVMSGHERLGGNERIENVRCDNSRSEKPSTSRERRHYSARRRYNDDGRHTRSKRRGSRSRSPNGSQSRFSDTGSVRNHHRSRDGHGNRNRSRSGSRGREMLPNEVLKGDNETVRNLGVADQSLINGALGAPTVSSSSPEKRQRNVGISSGGRHDNCEKRRRLDRGGDHDSRSPSPLAHAQRLNGPPDRRNRDRNYDRNRDRRDRDRDRVEGSEHNFSRKERREFDAENRNGRSMGTGKDPY